MMTFPPPRQRIYATLKSYALLASSLLAGHTQEDGPRIKALEEHLCQRTGASHALMVNQGRMGLYLALKTMLKPPRNRVILSPYTIFDVVNMVLCAGGEPVFADICENTCNLDPESVESRLDDRVGAVLVTHLHGLAADVERLRQLCDSRGLALVEDAAQSFGAKVAGRPVGHWGDVGMFSFGMMKNVNSFFGGAVITDNPTLRQAMAVEQMTYDSMPAVRLRNQALYGAVLDLATRQPQFGLVTYRVFRYGFLHNVATLKTISRSENNPVLRDSLPPHYRARPTGAQARVALEGLRHVEEHNRLRLENALVYYEVLKDVPGIALPPRRLDGSHTYMSLPVVVNDRDRVLHYLLTHGRDVIGQHLLNCADLPCFSRFASPCPVARKVSPRLILLPTHPWYGTQEAEVTARTLKACMESLA